MAMNKDGSRVGMIGEALWQSPLKELPRAPWGPRRDFAALCAGKGRNGCRMLWVLGGVDGNARFSDDIWCSVDGGSTWEALARAKRWSPRGRMGTTVGSTIPEPGPHRQTEAVKGIVYVVGGQGPTGLHADVWASDTMCRTWHRMSAKAPFGPRADMACAVVPGSPLTLVTGGGVSTDAHQDVWLSRDAGETFGAVEAPALPRGAAFRLWPPDILCAAKSAVPGKLAFWRLRIHEPTKESKAVSKPGSKAKASAELEELFDRFEDSFVEGEVHSLPVPPRLTLDLSTQVALVWDGRWNCLASHPVPCDADDAVSTDGDPMLFRNVTAPADNVYMLCDMDSVFASLRKGNLWVLSCSGAVWGSDRQRFRAQDHFMKLLGLRLHDMYGMPTELWLGRVRPMVLPRPRAAPKASGGKPGDGRFASDAAVMALQGA